MFSKQKMNFTYINRNGKNCEADFNDLTVVAEGPKPISNGWQSDRINYLKTKSIYIEFKSGPENVPGVVPSAAEEVGLEYIKSVYGNVV